MNKIIVALIAIILIAGPVEVNASKLKFVSIIFRHGARGPIYDLLNFNDEFNTFWREELTPTGQRQHFVLGQSLRERYITGDKFGLGLKENFDRKQIYVRSTDYNRTINSAQCQLTGLYPPGTGPYLNPNVEDYLTTPPYEGSKPQDMGREALPYVYQNIPVHNTPTSEDDLLNATGPVCPEADIINKAYWEDGETKYKIKQINEKYATILKDFTTVLGFKEPLQFTDMESVWDVLIADKFNGDPVEQDTKITPVMWEGLTQMDTLWWFIQGGSEEFYKIGTSKVLQSWIQYSEIALGNVEPSNKEIKELKYVMYSCHDDNLVNMMGALQISNYDCVWNMFNNKSQGTLNCEYRAYYAANIIYELYEAESKDTNPYVKILFDGEYINICGKKQTQCDYYEWKKQIEDWIFTDGEESKGLQIDQICNKKTEDNQKEIQTLKLRITDNNGDLIGNQQNQVATYLVIITIVVATIAAIIVGILRRKRLNPKETQQYELTHNQSYSLP